MTAWISLGEAIAIVERRLRVDALEAWRMIRTEGRCGKLELRHRGDQVETPVLPVLLSCLAEFGSWRIAFPEQNTVWIDYERAAKKGLKRAEIPERLAGLVVNKSQIDALWPEPPMSDAERDPAGAPRSNTTDGADFEDWTTPNRRGPVSKKKAEATARMIEAIQNKEITPRQLGHMKQKELGKLYPGAGRTTLAEARKEAIKILQQNSDETPANDK